MEFPSSSVSSKLNNHDHGPAITITTAIALGCTVLFILIRLYQRWPWSKLFKLEDAALIVALIFAIANAAAVALAVRSGLGKHADKLTNEQIDKTRKALIASFATFFLAEGSAQISFALLLRSFEVHKGYRLIMTILSGLVAIWMLAGLIQMAASASTQIASPTKASWIGYGVVAIIMQCVLFACAMWMIWVLVMPTSRKVFVSSWFTLCFPVAAVIVVRLVYTPSKTFGHDFTWDETNFIALALIEVNLMIVSAAYPSVAHFLRNVSTGFLVAETANTSSGQGKSAKHGSGSYALHSISKYSNAHNPISVGDRSEHHTATVRAENRSDKSFGSQAIMVRTSVEMDATSLPDSKES